MASSGKKGKKNKGTVISLQSFLSNGETPSGTTQVSKKLRNVDGEDSDEGSNSLPLVYQLPTAPRANRIFDDESIPHKAPFIAYVNNLPFDVNEDDIYDFFGGTPICALRLPREDGDTGRVRGYGYVEFETRDDLIHVLSLPDPSIKGRRIRIELSNENEQQNNRQRGGRRGFDGFSNNGENRDSTNWRRDNQNQESVSGNYSYDRGYDRDKKGINDDNGAPGSWRTGGGGGGGRSHTNEQRGGDRSSEKNREYNSRSRNFDREDMPRNSEGGGGVLESERPKLNLKPRTLPLPEIVAMSESDEVKEIGEIDETKQVKAVGVAAEKVFGSAKPVDTATRELEIEERLIEVRRLEKLKREMENAEVNEKLADIHIEKTNKENANSAISWRHRNEADTTNDTNNEGKYCSDSQDDMQHDNREREYNQNKKRENDRSETSKNRDGKQKDDNKNKRDTKTERALPKFQQPTAPILQCSNKYSGLDDEASD